MRDNLERKSRDGLGFWQVALPVLFLLILIFYSLILRPDVLGQEPLPLEIVFIMGATFALTELRILGFKWEDVLGSITAKLSRALPAFFILFSIGMIISSWIISGTIPMLVYYGIKIIHPNILYLLAFLVPVVFSTLTGTSLGSIGTIGVVFVGVASALDANLGITAGAIIGGAFFGDKISPLSDTTNLAAMTAEVDLYAHIRSMMYTTLPSALLAALAYAGLGFIYPPVSSNGNLESAQAVLNTLEGLFKFNILLLIPPVIVLWGSFRRYATIPVLMCSAFSACLLAFFLQRYTVADVMASLVTGFNVEMAPWMTEVPPQVAILLNRGGLYELVYLVVLTFIVFIFIGAIDHVRAMPVIVDRILGKSGTRPGTILTSLAAAALSSTVTSNQYATIFIIGDAFRHRYDEFGIPRQVLSRSLEDYGTMLVSLIPWHTAVIFSVSILGVPYSQFWHWQLLSLINLVIAPLLALTGIGCYLNLDNSTSELRDRTRDSIDGI